MHEDRYIIAANIAVSSNKASRELGRVQGKNFEIKGTCGSYIRDTYREVVRQVPSSSGSVFEYLCATVFHRLEMTPFAMKARLTRVPNMEIDILFWDTRTNQPIVIQLTSSLRERYSLADLQAFRLKSEYSGAKVYLLCMSQEEVAQRSDYPFESLDGLIFPDSEEFEDLIMLLNGIPKSELAVSSLETNVKSGRIIVTLQ